MPDFDPNVSPYIRKALERMNRCHCGRGPKKAETEICQACEDEAQADVLSRGETFHGD